MTISDENSLKQAIRQKESSVVVEDGIIGNALLVAGRIQEGRFSAVVLEKIKKDGVCRVSVGEGIIVPVTKGMALIINRLLDVLEEDNVEIDIEEVAGKKFNFYYNIGN